MQNFEHKISLQACLLHSHKEVCLYIASLALFHKKSLQINTDLKGRRDNSPKMLSEEFTLVLSPVSCAIFQEIALTYIVEHVLVLTHCCIIPILYWWHHGSQLQDFYLPVSLSHFFKHLVILLAECLLILWIKLAVLARVEHVLLLCICCVFRSSAWCYTESILILADLLRMF